MAVAIFVIGVLAFANAIVLLAVGYTGNIFGSLYGLPEWGWWSAALTIPALIGIIIFMAINDHILSKRRVARRAEPFVCMCHCLSGGLPRDLIRICRRVIAIGNGLDGDPTLARICYRLLEEDICAKSEALQPVFAERYRGPEGVHLLNLIGDLTGREMLTSRLRTHCKELAHVVARLPDAHGAEPGPGLAEFLGHLYHCLSMLEFFAEGLTEERLNNAVHNGSLDHLAGARQKLGVDVRVAWLALNAFRTDQILEPIGYPESDAVADMAADRYQSGLTGISPA